MPAPALTPIPSSPSSPFPPSPPADRTIIKRKLGLHLNVYDGQAELDAVRRLHPVIIHALVGGGQGQSPAQVATKLVQLRQVAGLECFVSVRLWLADNVAQGKLKANPTSFAMEMAVAVKEIARLLPPGTVNGWGGLNEIPTGMYGLWADWQQAFNAILFDVPVLAYGFGSGGSPTSPGEWQPLLKGLTAPNVVAWSQHEYWAGMSASHPDNGWRQFRFKTSQEALAGADAKLAGRVKVAITEAAYTGSLTDGEHGWRNSGLAEGEYARQLKEYAAGLQYDYVLGAAVFCGDEPGSFWANSFGVLGAGQVEQVIAQN